MNGVESAPVENGGGSGKKERAPWGSKRAAETDAGIVRRSTREVKQRLIMVRSRASRP